MPAGVPPERSYSRTDAGVRVEYPEPHELPSSKPVMGQGGQYSRPTLASLSLEGKVIVMTGGARGLGLVMGQGIVYSGAALAIVDLNKEEADSQVGQLTDAFKRENPNSEKIPKVTAHYADVSSQESVDSCIAEILKEHQKIDGLVTSAGFSENIAAIDYPIERIRKMWSVNVDGTYLFAVAVAKHLMGRQAPGSIVCIGSMSGSIVNIPQPQAPYNISKAAVRHMAASLAIEWAHAGIRVNCISPGYMLTAMTEKIIKENPTIGKTWTDLIPQGRMGSPQDLMGPVAFLLSDASAYMTGSEIRNMQYKCGYLGLLLQDHITNLQAFQIVMTLPGLAIYGLGIACIGRSLMAFTQPQAEYALNGLRHTVTFNDDPSSGPIYMLGLWEMSVGLLLLAHLVYGNSPGVTTLVGLMSLFKAGNAILIFTIGDRNKMGKSAGNVVTAVVLMGWAWYRGYA
ncbi:hypothetical protein F66182_5276 [Fusarium sp. NRRL 66182]|nr:hypothetical protein F66182_5276 [Fusarium sp. NRRL 66182]